MHRTRWATARQRPTSQLPSRRANALRPGPRVLRVELLEDRRLLSAGDTLFTTEWALADHPGHAPARDNNESEMVGRFVAAENALPAVSGSSVTDDPVTRSSDLASPTALEQYLLELINRGRANPSGEADRYDL
ncbi:MAG: hypothetical protein R6U98_02775, partial [Pirellulaceae bacterium]